MSDREEIVAPSGKMSGWQWRVFSANYLGLVFEAYDLTVYSLLVVPISKYFDVPSWYSFFVLTIMYVLRGVGGLVFGQIADKMGRRNALVFTVLGYSLATGLTGASWNLISLLIFRALSGLFIGGEYVGYSYTIEVVPSRFRGHFSGAIVSSYSTGFLLATASFWLGTVIDGPDFVAGEGWRALFFVGVLPALIALWLRLGVPESPVWQRASEGKATKARVPILEIFMPKYLGRTLHCWLLMAALIWAYDVVALAQPSMLHYLGVPNDQIGSLTLIANVGALIAALLGGWLAQRIGRRKALLVIAACGVPIIFLFAPFWAIPPAPTYLYLAISGFVAGLVFEAGFGVMPAFLSENYPTHIRATGAAGTYNLGQLIAGWSLTLLAVGFGGDANSFMKGIVINALVALAVLLLLTFLGRETRGVKLEEHADNSPGRLAAQDI
jgi:MFS transporter, SHS family, lactate transporter